MQKNKVYFITPTNETIALKYSDINYFCKKLCIGDYKNEFNEFKKEYTYFSPYFDFVMFSLNYIFVNPLFLKNKCLYSLDGALYLSEVVGSSYDANMKNASDNFKNNNPLSFMTKVSDEELDLKKQTGGKAGDLLIDPNLMGMMSETGTIYGSHSITANSILNQLLILSPTLEDEYHKYILEKGIDYYNDALNFMIANLGFIRATSYDSYPMLIGNKEVLNDKQKEFIVNCENNGYNVLYIEQEYSPMSLEYKKLIKR